MPFLRQICAAGMMTFNKNAQQRKPLLRIFLTHLDWATQAL
jgi:hypothetical protein